MKVPTGIYLVSITTEGGWGSTEILVKKRMPYPAFVQLVKTTLLDEGYKHFAVIAISRVAKKGWFLW